MTQSVPLPPAQAASYPSRADDFALFVRALKADKIYCEMERTVHIKQRYQVKNEEILLELYDHENEDGDVVSVCFNGQYIVEHYLLLKKPKQLKIKLLANHRNVLTIFANNTGKEGANTSAIRFELNGKRQEIILYADKKESEGIEFIF
jgi:diaminopimelate epimerase